MANKSKKTGTKKTATKKTEEKVPVGSAAWLVPHSDGAPKTHFAVEGDATRYKGKHGTKVKAQAFISAELDRLFVEKCAKLGARSRAAGVIMAISAWTGKNVPS